MLCTVIRVGSPGVGVAGSSEPTGEASSVAWTKAWLEMTVPLGSGVATVASKPSCTSPPGERPTVPRVQVIRPAAKLPPFPGVTAVRFGSMASVTTTWVPWAFPVFRTVRV